LFCFTVSVLFKSKKINHKTEVLSNGKIQKGKFQATENK
jgi:hypothetical protein